MSVRRGPAVFTPRPGHAFYCTRCGKEANPRMVRERRQVMDLLPGQAELRTLFHANTLFDWSECGGAIEERALQVLVAA